MPIYEFVCQNCGSEFERILSFSDTSSPDCPACESSQVTRQMGRPAIHFKGSGWYINDSKKDKGKSVDTERKNDSDESTSETKRETAGESSSESTGDAASDSAGETKRETSKADTKADSSAGDVSKGESNKSATGTRTSSANKSKAKSDS